MTTRARKPATAIQKRVTRPKPSPPKQSSPPKRPAVYDRPETNAFLKKEKAEILKAFDFRHQSVMRQRGFAICLMALGRLAEALQVLDYAQSNVEYRGKAYAWYSAGSACSVASYLRRTEGDDARAAKDMLRFLEPPCHAIISQTDLWTADFVRSHLAEERLRFAPEFDDPKPRFAIEARTWWIATLVFFREFALIGFPRQGGIDVKQLDSWIDAALAELKGKLIALER